MKIAEFKQKLETLTQLTFLKPDGSLVPAHFHITEVGQIDKRFIDCGGAIRQESFITMQLWENNDVWHQLAPSKLISIIDLSIEKLGIGNHEIEMEYQNDSIGKYHLGFENGVFNLIATQTACLASDQCVVPEPLSQSPSCCSPNSGCC